MQCTLHSEFLKSSLSTQSVCHIIDPRVGVKNRNPIPESELEAESHKRNKDFACVVAAGEASKQQSTSPAVSVSRSLPSRCCYFTITYRILACE